MRKNAILTFDYEVCLGKKTGTLNNCVILPVHQVLELLKRNNAHAIFFVDATWLLFLKDCFPDDLSVVADQLKEIVEAGSSVELHLHPQWLKAEKEGDEIVFKSFINYKLQSMTQEDILDLFGRSIDLLESITLQKVRCFRAGGFCIEPFGEIQKSFEKFNIKYDFSVTPGMRLNGGNVYDYDFIGAPRLPAYKFSNDVKTVDNNGSFIEVPISTYNNNPVYRLINILVLKLKGDKIFGDGTGIQEKSYYFFRSIYRRVQFSKALLSIDRTWSLFFKYLLKFHFIKSSMIVLISHPKTMSHEALINLSYITIKYNTMNSGELDGFLKSYLLNDTDKKNNCITKSLL